MGAEIELKLDVSAAGAVDLVNCEWLGVGGKVRRLASTYFDTPDEQLRKHGLVLRIRRDRRRLTQTVKRREGAAAGLFTRGEWEVPVHGFAPVMDERTPLPDAIGSDVRVLAPMFAVEIDRTSRIVDHGASRIEVAVDRGRAHALDRASEFVELELELIDGNPRDLFALARRIDNVASVRIGVLSKSDRGFRLVGPIGTAIKAGKPALEAEWSPVTACSAIMAECMRHYRANEALLLLERSGEALHQARVALRRLRSAHAVFAPLLRDPRSARLDLAVRQLSRVLGAARDLDVVWSAAGEEAQAMLQPLREQGWRDVGKAIGAAWTRHLFLDLAEWGQFGEWREADATAELRNTPLRNFAGAALDRRLRQVRRHGHHLPDLPDDARHALRKDVKKLRYAAEFFAPLYRDGTAKQRRKAFTASLERLQGALGKLNDHVVEQALLGAMAPDRRSERTELLLRASDARHGLLDCKPFW